MSQLMASAIVLSSSVQEWRSGAGVLRRVSVGVDVDVVAVELHRIAGERGVRRVDALARLHVELPQVDRAGERRPVEQPLGEVPLLVGALHLGGPHLPTGEVHEQDPLALDLEGLHVTFPEIVERADLHESHRWSRYSLKPSCERKARMRSTAASAASGFSGNSAQNEATAASPRGIHLVSQPCRTSWLPARSIISTSAAVHRRDRSLSRSAASARRASSWSPLRRALVANWRSHASSMASLATTLRARNASAQS